MSWPKIKKKKTKKKTSFWSVIFSYYMLKQQTISQVDCDMWQRVDFI